MFEIKPPRIQDYAAAASRKRKLLDKQKEDKKRTRLFGKVEIRNPPSSPRSRWAIG
jgi:translation elongation factor EF-4